MKLNWIKTSFVALVFCLSNAAVYPGVAGPETPGLKLPPYKKITLAGGTTLLLMEQHEVPLISLSLLIKAGPAGDAPGKEGLASLTASLLRKGTRSRSADQIAAELDFIGAQMQTDINADYTAVSAEFMKKDVEKGLDLTADILLNPTFPQEEVTKLIKQRIDEIRSAKDQAQAAIPSYYNRFLYGDHPYGKPVGGDERSLAAISKADITRFYETNYTPSNVILAIVGDFATAEMERRLAAKLAGWPTKPSPAVTLPPPQDARGRRLLLVDKPDSTQTFYRIGNVGIARTDTDRVHVAVVNTLFGGRFTSMLNTELRVNSGLTYGARSVFELRKQPGPFAIASFTANETTERALDMTLDILKRLHENGVSESELQSAKKYIKGQFPPTIETSSQLATLLSSLEFYGLDENEVNGMYARIDSMTVADARRIIKEHFPLENLVFVLIGKAGDIEKVAKKYAPQIETKSITEPGF